jgi:hypothetical protein
MFVWDLPQIKQVLILVSVPAVKKIIISKRFDIFYLRVKWSTKWTEGSLNFGGGGKKLSEKFLSLINLWPDLEQVIIGR